VKDLGAPFKKGDKNKTGTGVWWIHDGAPYVAFCNLVELLWCKIRSDIDVKGGP